MRIVWLCAATVFVLTAVTAIGVSPADTKRETKQDPKHCPLMGTAECPMAAKAGAKEPATAGEHRDHVNRQGDKVMRFPHSESVHHFALSKAGGEIRVEASWTSDRSTVAQIREHLKIVASAFANGDFRMPAEIHGRVVPGAVEMNRRRSGISYRYERLESGARVVIDTRDPVALEAVHEFLRFQIRDHATGDPTEVLDGTKSD